MLQLSKGMRFKSQTGEVDGNKKEKMSTAERLRGHSEDSQERLLHLTSEAEPSYKEHLFIHFFAGRNW